MLNYYLRLALHGLKRNKALTTLMVLAISIGIGASMTMMTVLHVISGDPLPGLSVQLFHPNLDARPLKDEVDGKHDQVDANLTWPDARYLLQARRAERQAAMAGGSVLIRPAGQGLRPFFQEGHYVDADFFAMFGTPFLAGRGWGAAEDEQRARVLVLNGGLARQLFGDATLALGHILRLQDTDFRVVGVLDDWDPQPQFYGDIGGNAFGKADGYFLPLSTAMNLGLEFAGNLSCWDSKSDRQSDHCTWLQFWVQLSTSAQAQAYQQFISDYWRQQKDLGRFPRSQQPRLYPLMGWLDHVGLVPGDVRVQLWLALGFLGVCMLNTVGLLLAKFLRRGGEISIRRALGARRRDVFLQFGVESAVIGLVGGLFGLGLAQVGLWSMRQRPDAYAQLAHMDAMMLASTFGLAVFVTVLAGLLPAWRVCGIAPALQLKIA